MGVSSCVHLTSSPLPSHLVQYALKGRLDESYAPFIRKPRSSSSSCTSGWGSGSSSAAGAGITTTSVRQRWNWVPSKAGGTDNKEVSGSAPPTYIPLTHAHTHTHTQSQAAKKAGPTIIIFIIGGMTHSEMRAIYEVSKASTDCEVVIGKPHHSVLAL